MSDRKQHWRMGLTMREGPSFSERQVFLDRVHQIEDSIKDRDTERLYVLGEDGHEVVPPWDGTDGEVNTRSLQRQAILHGRRATHNHPNNSALSDGDVSTLVHAEMLEIRAVTRNGFVYSLRRIGTTEKTNQFAKDYKNLGYAHAMKNASSDWDNGRGNMERFKMPNGLYDKAAFMEARFNFHLRRWAMGHAKEYGFEYTEGRNA